MYLIDEMNRDFVTGKANRPSQNGCGTFAGLALLLVIFLFGVLPAFGAASKSISDADELKQHHRQVQATVIGKRVEVSPDDSADENFISYAFETGGREFKRTVKVNDDRYQQIQAGGTISVVYDTERPSNSALSDGNLGGNSVPATIFAILIVAMFFLFAYGVLKPELLRRRGKFVSGVALGSTEDGDETRIGYKFVSPTSGEELRGSCTMHEAKDGPASGEDVGVLYLTDKMHTLL